MFGTVSRRCGLVVIFFKSMCLADSCLVAARHAEGHSPPHGLQVAWFTGFDFGCFSAVVRLRFSGRVFRQNPSSGGFDALLQSVCIPCPEARAVTEPFFVVPSEGPAQSKLEVRTAAAGSFPYRCCDLSLAKCLDWFVAHKKRLHALFNIRAS